MSSLHDRPLLRSPALRAFGLGALLLAAPATRLGAQQRDTTRLPDLVVTAEPVPVPIANVAAAMTVLQGDDLRARGVRSVADALREVPGAAVVPVGSYGGQTSLFLRGGESDFVKVLVDGVPLNQPGGAFDFAGLTLDNIERIEVVRGPVSVLYGTDAVTGVVNLITREGNGPTALRAGFRAGSFGSTRGEGSASGGAGNLGYSLGLAHEHSDGIQRFNNQFSNTVGSGSLRLGLAEGTSVRLTVRYDDDAFHFPTDGGGVAVDSNQASARTQTAVGASIDHQATSRLLLHLTASLSTESDDFENQPDSPGDTLGFGYASSRSEAILRRTVDARATLTPSERVTLTGGVEVAFDRDRVAAGFSAFNFGTGQDTSLSAPFAESRRNVGIYLDGLSRPAGGWTVSLGGRLDQNQKFGSFVTGRAGVVRRLDAWTRLRATAGTAFKVPTFEENFGSSAFSRGNPDLSPERSLSFEIGADRTFAAGRVRLAASYFDQRFRDLIQYGDTNPAAPTYFNVAAANARGLELELELRPAAALELAAGYTWLHTEVTDPGFNSGDGDVFVRGQPLIRRPAHSGHARLSWLAAARGTIGAELTVVGRREDVDFRPFPSVRVVLPAYALVDLGAEIELVRRSGGRPGIDATLRLENLFDARYDTVVGFPGRGRAIFAGAQVGL
jgi:vitamin B12 transporter